MKNTKKNIKNVGNTVFLFRETGSPSGICASTPIKAHSQTTEADTKTADRRPPRVKSDGGKRCEKGVVYTALGQGRE